MGLTALSLMASPIGYWRSPEGQREYESAYKDAMRRLPPVSKTYDVETDFGTVRVYQWTDEQTAAQTPILLLPGRLSGVPMWEKNIKDLIAERPVYAVDAIGDSGMSVQTQRIAGDADQARWVEQTLNGPGLKRVHLAGHSFGGWTAANYASRYPDRVASLSLMEPVRTFEDMRLEIYLRSIPASLPFLPRSWRDQFLTEVGGTTELDPNDPMTRMISAASKHYAVALPFPGRIKPEQMRAWPMPVFVALGAKSAMHDSAKAVEVAKDNVRHLEVSNWPDGTHSLPMEEPDKMDALLLAFMRRAEQASNLEE
ncbi:alpha/beta fold hydrolase [Melittangium boletus]|uniref:AB hydrolase-1 domain-containing protein n=1 Tax=Melittangium boletus DSM 14713 TaxID=1294270 RepID=A0A250I8U4_9BACT|nr:alpha/beta hydrolase [Melittangium boletus]ATB27633.1 hypothetical protein MEBOL_001077 [Melittangium boletus DSM 14713]